MNDIKPDEPTPPKDPDLRDQQGPLPSKLNKRSSPSNESANQGRRQKVPWSLILMVGVAFLIIWAANNGRKGDRIDYGFFWQQLKAENVTEVVLDGSFT